MIYLIGTGLYYLNDIPLRAVDLLKKADEVFLERYTNLNDLSCMEEIERTIGKTIKIKGRDFFESEEPIRIGKAKDIAILVPGDPLAATTHISLVAGAKKAGIEVKVVHASSIFTAAGSTGLSLYKFGAVTSIPMYHERFNITSFIDTIRRNKQNGLHSLVLLEALDESRFVSEKEAVEAIKRNGEDIIDENKVIVLSRIGSEDEKISMFKRIDEPLKPPLSLIIPGDISKIEEENMNILLG
ncbi:MAG: diphthine synthase [Candidatus Parvarchaeota archaeon]|nr:diphthine synthase [Candidatus Parvarchaeota archaeon]